MNQEPEYDFREINPEEIEYCINCGIDSENGDLCQIEDGLICDECWHEVELK